MNQATYQEYRSLLDIVTKKTCTAAFKMESSDLFVFEFGDLTEKSELGLFALDRSGVFIQTVCSIQVMWRNKLHINRVYDDNTPIEDFNSDIQSLIGRKVVRVDIDKYNDLWLDLEGVWIRFETFNDGYDSWKLIISGNQYSLCLSANNYEVSFHQYKSEELLSYHNLFAYINCLKQLVGKTLSLAFKFTDCELYAFRFGKITDSIIQHESDSLVFYELSIHSIGIIQIVPKINKDNYFEYTGDSSFEKFNSDIQHLIGSKVQNIKLSRCNYLSLDLGEYLLRFETYANQDETWRFISSSNVYPHLVANDRTLFWG